MARKVVSLLSLLSLLGIILLTLIYIYLRGQYVEQVAGQYTACKGCYLYRVVISDASIVGVALFLFGFSLIFKNRFIVFIMRLLAVTLCFILVVDSYIEQDLSNRLYYFDIQKYFHLSTIYHEIKQKFRYTYLFVIFGLIAFSFLMFFVQANKKYFKTAIILISCGVVGVLIGCYPIKSSYVHAILYDNVFSVNYNQTEANKFSEQFANKLKQNMDNVEKLTCVQGLAAKKNVIMVVIESLSSYQSKLLSGMNDYMPNIDKLAKDNTYYSNFYANNFNTTDGHVALLTGDNTLLALANFKNSRSELDFNKFNSIPKILTDYHSAFFNSSDLTFGDEKFDIDSMKFNYVEDSSYHGYDTAKRYGFNGVNDVTLYKRLLDYVNIQKSPYFIFAATISTHPPFVDPISSELNIEKSFHYADKAVFDFYQQLDKIGFFNSGILIITGDHRAMVPTSKEETEKYGEMALARVPFIVIDKGLQRGEINNDVQQSDFLASLQYLLTDKSCSHNGQGNLFSVPTKSASCIFHSRGDYRDTVSVKCGNEVAIIKLDGDNTRVISGKLSREQSAIDYINTKRLINTKTEK